MQLPTEEELEAKMAQTLDADPEKDKEIKMKLLEEYHKHQEQYKNSKSFK